MLNPADAGPGWAQRHFRAMGSTAHVVVLVEPDGAGAEPLLDWTEQEAQRLEAAWSRFRVDSDVSRINRAAGGEPVVVGPETFSLVERAIDAWRATAGRFDPTVLHALEALGYDDTFAVVRDRPQGRTVVRSAPPGLAAIDVAVGDLLRPVAVPAPGCAAIVLDHDRCSIAMPAGVGIDLGGIGKGAAADHLAEGLVARGAAGACVAMGGDVRAAGAVPGGFPWPIPVEDPFEHDREPAATMVTVPLRDGAVVTSTRLIHRWVHGGVLQHHLVDPATGRPADRGVAAVVVQAPTACWAEVLAKAALVAGVHEGCALLAGHGVTGWVVADDGRVWPVRAQQPVGAAR